MARPPRWMIVSDSGRHSGVLTFKVAWWYRPVLLMKALMTLRIHYGK